MFAWIKKIVSKAINAFRNEKPVVKAMILVASVAIGIYTVLGYVARATSDGYAPDDFLNTSEDNTVKGMKIVGPMSVGSAMLHNFDVQPTFYIYMCEDRRPYYGITFDMNRRIYQHSRDSAWFDKAKWVIVLQNKNWTVKELRAIEKFFIRNSRILMDLYNKQHASLPMSAKACLIKAAVTYMWKHFILMLAIAASILLGIVAIYYIRKNWEWIKDLTPVLELRKAIQVKRTWTGKKKV